MGLQPISEQFDIDELTRGAHNAPRWLMAGLCREHPVRAHAVEQFKGAQATYTAEVTEAVRTIRPPTSLRNPAICSALIRFAYALCEQPHVTEAWSSIEEGVAFVWVFIDEDSIEVRRRVFKAEEDVMDRSPDLEFDFYVFSVECREAFLDEGREAEQFYVRT